MLFAHRWVYLLEQLKLGNHILLTDVDNIFSSYYSMTELELSEYDVYPCSRNETSGRCLELSRLCLLWRDGVVPFLTTDHTVHGRNGSTSVAWNVTIK
jgi:hypothetical protein